MFWEFYRWIVLFLDFVVINFVVLVVGGGFLRFVSGLRYWYEVVGVKV